MLLVTAIVCPAFAQEESEKDLLGDLVSEIKKTKGKQSEQKAFMIPFNGKLVNYGSPILVPENYFTELKNFRYFDNGIGTRKGMSAFTSAEPNAREIIDLFPFETDTESHIVAVSADATGQTYYQVETGAFGTVISHTTGSTATPPTHAKIRDTLTIGDVGGVSMYSGVSVFPTALLVEYSNGVFTDRYDWIHSGTVHNVGAGNTIHAGYSRPFDGMQLNSSSASMDSVASSVTEYLKSGKARYWRSDVVGYGATGFVTNGDFNSGTTTGWNSINVYSAFAPGYDGTGVTIYSAAAGAYAYIWQDVSGLVVGASYKLSFYYRNGTDSSGAYIVQHPIGNNLLVSTTLNHATWTNVTATFTATSTAARIYFGNASPAAADLSNAFDKIELISGSSTIYLPKIKSNARELGSSWDGQAWAYPVVAGFQKTGTSPFQDYSLHLQDNSEETYMDISQMQSGGTIFGGWLQKPREIHIYLPEEYKNTTAATITVKYWKNSTWTTIGSVTDGTASGGIVFAKSGVISIPKLTDWETRQISDIPFDVYAIAIKVSTTIGNYVRIHKMVALPDYDSPSSVGKYTMTAASHNRHILANGRDRTKLLVSAENQPDCFIGEDAAPEDEPIEVGRREDFIWIGPVGAETLIMKQSENFTMIGVNPNTWEIQPLYGTKPCVSTKSVQVVEINGTRFVIYAGRGGVYTIPAIEGINSDDIKAYFEPGNTLEFSYEQLKHSRSWHDQTFNEYHLIVGTTELVLNLKAMRWSVFDRANNVSCGTYFVGSDNQRYHLGGAKTGGTIYSLESGSTDSGSTIVCDLTRPASVLGKNFAGKSELRAVALRYQLMDSATGISGCTAYLTSSLGSGATTYQAAFNLPDEGWQYLNLLNWRDGVKGFTHKRRYRFPGRLSLLGEIIWSREAEWPREATTVP
jgi:hypothetical protein